ncbi:Hsp20/alpha crystallin family protein [Candidatus Binatia bacterium]|nr:Hsp20/alpha crystallin family protein [Candidatus Binatia bacterium]
MASQELNGRVKSEVTGAESTRPGRVYSPHIDICETPEALWLYADMPGVDDKAVDVSVAEGVLTVDGRVSLAEYENLQPVYTEYNVGNFLRRLSISADIDTGRINARLRDGVLELELPKAERAKPRRIQVQTA